MNLATLELRRQQLCLNFAVKCVKNPKHSHMFPKTNLHQLRTTNYRKCKNERDFFEQKCRTGRLYKSAIPYMTRLLNESSTP